MIDKKQIVVLALVLLVSIGLGTLIGQTVFFPTPSEVSHQEHEKMWTCSMHPQIKKSKQGKCPICAMELIPIASESKKERKIKYWQAPMDPSYKRDRPGKSPMGMDLVPVYEESADDESTRELRLSKRAEKLAEVELSPVIRAFAEEDLRLSGMLVVDETRFRSISARFPGRIEKLFIDYTGIRVDKNDHMAVVYSPELLVAQKELIEAKRSQIGKMITSSREKLRLWGLSSQQIRSIERTGKVTDTLTINAPIGGTVLKKHVSQGDYVKTGGKIYEIADLSRVWLIADVYESDAQKVQFGQKVVFTTKAYPGEQFEGTVTFVDPVVNPKTRIIRLRAVINNTEGKLKPDMLAEVIVKVKMGAKGVVSDSDLSNLWVGPMHPEETSTKPGKCSICGMNLKKARSLGLVSNIRQEKPLLIPATAPLLTGKRAIVYVRNPNKKGVYEGREIHLGSRVGEHYIVKHGLKEGEQVVTKGNFKIDSAMQILAKPSMMQTQGSKPVKSHSH